MSPAQPDPVVVISLLSGIDPTGQHCNHLLVNVSQSLSKPGSTVTTDARSALAVGGQLSVPCVHSCMSQVCLHLPFPFLTLRNSHATHRQGQDLTEPPCLLAFPLCTKTGLTHHSPISSPRPLSVSPLALRSSYISQRNWKLLEEESPHFRPQIFKPICLLSVLCFASPATAQETGPGSGGCSPTGPVCTEVLAKVSRAHLQNGFSPPLCYPGNLHSPLSP